MTGFRQFVKLGRGLIFGIGEVMGSCGLIVYKSMHAYLGLPDAFESVIISSSLICSGDLLKFCLNSEFP